MGNIKDLWENSKTLTIMALVQWLTVLLLIYAALILPSIELKLVTSGLAIAFASIASSNMLNLSEKKDREAILEKLSNIEKIQQEMQSEQREQISPQTRPAASPVAVALRFAQKSR